MINCIYVSYYLIIEIIDWWYFYAKTGPSCSVWCYFKDVVGGVWELKKMSKCAQMINIKKGTSTKMNTPF